LFFLHFIPAHGQLKHLTFRHITRGNGLPADNITALTQDSSGFIWIGTTEGLFRYDGFSFTGFKTQQEAKNAPANSITKILVSKNGALWIGTIGGGISVLQKNGVVVKTYNSKTSPLISALANHVSDIAEDNKGNIWWTSVDGLFKIDTKGRLSCFKLPAFSSRSNLFNSIAFDKNEKLWLGGFLGIRIFDPVSQTFSLPHDNWLQKRKDVSRIFFYNNRLWHSSWIPDFCSYDTLTKKASFLYKRGTKEQPDFNYMSNAFCEDDHENLWVATGNGLQLITNNNNTHPQVFSHQADNNFTIINNKINCLLQDREGMLWIGTEEGISCAQPYQQRFINYSENVLQTAQYGNKNVNNVIVAGKNALLLGTHNADGIYLTDTNFVVKKHFQFNNVKWDWTWTYFDGSIRNQIFIATQEGMLLYQKKPQTIKKLTQQIFNDGLPISAFAAVDDSTVWMSKFRDVFIHYNLRTGKYKQYSVMQFGLEPQVLFLAASADKRSIWLMAHHYGLLQFDITTEKIIQRLKTNGEQQSLRQANISFLKDLGTYLLIGYSSKGLSLYNKQTGNYRHFTKETGLSSDNTNAVYCRNNDVWIATSNGISRLNLDTYQIKNYGFEQGLLNAQILSINGLPNGLIVAGTQKGVIAFHADQIDKTATLTPPFITGAQVYGRNVPVDSAQKEGLAVAYNENYFSFDYITLQFVNNNSIEYAYKLEGLDKDWIYAGNRRFASYSHVKGGHYSFKVKARRNGEAWVESVAPINVIVHSAFYTRWWFYALCLLFAFALAYLLFRYRVRQLLKLAHMRTSISSDLHDEVGATLTSISIFSEMARRSNPQTTEEYLQRIGDRSRESIEKMSDIIWSINPDNDNLQQMLVRMKNYVTEVAEGVDVQVHWNEGENISAAKLTMEQRKNIYLLFKEAVNNSIKHAAAQNLWIQLTYAARNIRMQVKDDGKSFDAEKIKKGNGLQNMHRRAAALGGALIITTKPGRGTDIMVSFLC
jgi:ligand-binding sensor domain-containing protein/two-component sensor histidine kinase